MTAAMLLLVRHGESTWNAERRWQGQADPPLSARGVEQARAAALRLRELAIGVERITSSSLRRARETAEILATGLGLGPSVVSPVAELMERHAGGFEGLTRDEIEERYPGFLSSGQRPEGYEAVESIVSRAAPALASLAVTSEGAVHLVVTHGGVLLALERGAGEQGRPYANLQARRFEVTAQATGGPQIRPVGEHLALVDDVAVPDLTRPVERDYS